MKNHIKTQAATTGLIVKTSVKAGGQHEFWKVFSLAALLLIIAVAARAEEHQVCTGTGPLVAILVDPSLVDGIHLSLEQFEIDLCNEGYAVIEERGNFTTPPEVRTYLAELYARTQQRLVGAILIGNLPHAYQWVRLSFANPDIPPLAEEVISFQYYADLDGNFEASSGYLSPAGHSYSYDVHSGNLDSEIWIGVLPFYKGNLESTTEAINLYFAKNHAYRSGLYTLPRAFLEVSEFFVATTQNEQELILSYLRSGQYAWTPFSTSPDARLYFDSPPGGLSVNQGYLDLSAGRADFTVLDAHGFWGASGRLDIDWIESNPVRTTFLWSNGCAVGNLDYADNFLTSALYSPTSAILVAKGTSNDSGGMGNNENGFFGHNVATALSEGASFGQAILSHVNVPLIYPWSESREFHFATAVVLGDPTLSTSPACTYSIAATSQTFNAAGGSDSVGVTAPATCTWTATSTDSWITITSSPSGRGDSSVMYFVSANPSATSRTGTITIAGSIFTVNEAGVAGNKCPRGQGFWKNHSVLWPVSSLTLGRQSYSEAELLTILKTPPRADASLILAKQLIAAKLNIANGSNPAPISDALTDADALLAAFEGKLPYGVTPSSTAGEAMLSDTATVDNYSSGKLTEGCTP